MKSTKLSKRLLALAVVFSFLPLIFSFNNETADTYRPKQQTGFTISAFSTSFPLSPISEESLQKNTARLSRFHTYKNLDPPRRINYWFGGKLFLFIAAFIIFAALILFHKGNTYTRRYLIKYIHDKDGHKI